MNMHKEVPGSGTFLRVASVIVMWAAIVLSLCLLWLWRDAVSSVGNFFAPYISPPAEASAADPEAFLLASLESNPHAPTEKEIALFDLLLANLQIGCRVESRSEIAHALVFVRREAVARGKDISLRAVIPLIAGTLPKIPPGSGSCVEAAEAYATLVSL